MKTNAELSLLAPAPFTEHSLSPRKLPAVTHPFTCCKRNYVTMVQFSLCLNCQKFMSALLSTLMAMEAKKNQLNKITQAMSADDIGSMHSLQNEGVKHKLMINVGWQYFLLIIELD